jgi:hypothetical protein
MTLYFKVSVRIEELYLNTLEKAQKVDKTFIFKRDFSAVCNVSRDVQLFYIF